MKLYRRHSFASFALVAALFVSVPLASPPVVNAADIAQTAASVVPSSNALIQTGTAQATIVAGNPVYYDTASAGFKPAKANALGGATVAGIAVNNAGVGQPVQYCVQDSSFTLGGTLAIGGVLYLSGASSGGVTSTYADLTSGMVVVVLGVGNGSGNKFNLKINQGGTLP